VFLLLGTPEMNTYNLALKCLNVLLKVSRSPSNLSNVQSCPLADDGGWQRITLEEMPPGQLGKHEMFTALPQCQIWYGSV